MKVPPEEIEKRARALADRLAHPGYYARMKGPRGHAATETNTRLIIRFAEKLLADAGKEKQLWEANLP